METFSTQYSYMFFLVLKFGLTSLVFRDNFLIRRFMTVLSWADYVFFLYLHF
jgi:hypothetical protein